MGDGKVCFQQMKKLFMKMTLIAALFFFPCVLRNDLDLIS